MGQLPSQKGWVDPMAVCSFDCPLSKARRPIHYRCHRGTMNVQACVPAGQAEPNRVSRLYGMQSRSNGPISIPTSYRRRENVVASRVCLEDPCVHLRCPDNAPCRPNLRSHRPGRVNAVGAFPPAGRGRWPAAFARAYVDEARVVSGYI